MSDAAGCWVIQKFPWMRVETWANVRHERQCSLRDWQGCQSKLQ